MKKQKTNKVKTVVYLIHFILIDIWARNGVLHIFFGGGVGWGAMSCTVMHTIALAHMLDATQLHLRTCWMLRNCTCAHVRCYAIALAHMLDATHLHLRTCWMLRTCTCAHVRCYATALAHMFDATQLHLRTSPRCYAIALAHMFDATQLHLRTCSMLRNCTCAHHIP